MLLPTPQGGGVETAIEIESDNQKLPYMDNISDFLPLTCPLNVHGLQREGMYATPELCQSYQKPFCHSLDILLITSYPTRGIVASFIF